MEKASKKRLRDFVNSQHFTSTTTILNSMKDLFSDVLQQVMEAELEETLGLEKYGHASKIQNPARAKTTVMATLKKRKNADRRSRMSRMCEWLPALRQ